MPSDKLLDKTENYYSQIKQGALSNASIGTTAIEAAAASIASASIAAQKKAIDSEAFAIKQNAEKRRIRQEIAVKAMNAILSSPNRPENEDDIVNTAIICADKLLHKLEVTDSITDKLK